MSIKYLIAATLALVSSAAQATTFYYSNTLAITSQSCSGQACAYPNVPVGIVSMQIIIPGDTTGISDTFNAIGTSDIIATASFGYQNGFANNLIGMPPSVAGPLSASVTLTNGAITDWNFHGTYNKYAPYCGICDVLDSTSAGDHLVYTLNYLFTDFSSYTITYDGEAGVWSQPSTVAQFLEVQQATTPLPGALPLFMTGLSAIGIMIWRRRRQ